MMSCFKELYVSCSLGCRDRSYLPSPHHPSRPLYNRNRLPGRLLTSFVLSSRGSLSICPYSFSPVGQNNCWGSGPSGWASVCFGQRTALLHGGRLSTEKTGKNDGDQLWADCPHCLYHTHGTYAIDVGWEVVLCTHLYSGLNHLFILEIFF